MELNQFETEELIEAYTKIQDFLNFLEKEEKENNK